MTTTPAMTITDEQISEIEAYYTPAEEKGMYWPGDDRVLALISRLRAAEKDRDRLDFISGNWFENCAFFPSRIEFAYNEQWYEEGSNLREAIDAAMEQSE